MENYKIKVNNEAESKEAQELLFEFGFGWCRGDIKRTRNTSASYIYCYNISKDMTFGDRDESFYNHKNKEITLQQLRDLSKLTKACFRGCEPSWERNPETPNTSTKDKLKFIEKWLNGEKIQYILGVESEKTQWHNFTEGAMQYIKRSDIKFREAPKYVTINGIEFKSVESLLKYVKNNFDLDGGIE